MSDEAASTSRRSNRSNVMLKATLQIPGAELEVVLRNLSEDGALIQGKPLPQPQTRVLFQRQGLSVPGRIAWSHYGFAGLEFDFPLFPKELLRHVPSPAQRVDIPIKRPGLSSRPLTPAERSLIQQWAVRSA
ncbi:PilZ domain-containing protein [Sphingomonas sabuli]|uniref:PilZ domain-containing protein n=1 Tax=Sphingomonas sabuli TaxID=2764186 RepID=A0A7G9L321_9SPHN|nr:PilZ domain-containing protein [Sphingomonas sabuli]QNM83020.1 PilZ domain-containing protein [Sphingomonas sabuli]